MLSALLAPVLVEAGKDDGGFDLFKIQTWGKKKDNNEANKDTAPNQSEEADLVHELDELDEDTSSQALNRRSSTRPNNSAAIRSNDNPPRRMPPPRRPLPPLPVEDDLIADQEEKVADRRDMPQELRGCVKNSDDLSSPPDQRRTVRPNIKYKSRGINSEKPRANRFSSEYLGRKLKGAYTSTKNSLISIPKYVGKASDRIAATMKINEKGRLLALIDELNKSMNVVRQAFSEFTETWSPLMEQALNYVGTSNLNKLRWNDNDEFDFRRDALNVLAAGYEFMRIMIAWRQNTLTAHAAYRLYLETVKNDLSDPSIVVDEDFIYQLEAIHNYILFKSWLLLDSINLEPKMKFEYLSQKHDDRLRNYESDYFRSIIVFQELYEPTMEELDNSRQDVIDSVSTTGALVDEFAEVDEFIEDFVKSLDETPIPEIELTPELIKLMAELKPEIQYNPQIYDKKFMLKLIQAKEEAMKEIKQEEQVETNV